MPDKVFAFTHWACFDCRKSFAKEPVARGSAARKCPECARSMIDMGPYFEPPRRLNKKRWNVMKLLVDNGYRFRSEGSRSYIDTFILQVENPRLADVEERIRADLALRSRRRRAFIDGSKNKRK
ncbi:MAG: hypothetical protein JSS81_29125 [Acidobacteria bacterium]|nr:hypothetical protein [Acidobacteriota bacterium]